MVQMALIQSFVQVDLHHGMEPKEENEEESATAPMADSVVGAAPMMEAAVEAVTAAAKARAEAEAEMSEALRRAEAELAHKSAAEAELTASTTERPFIP